MRVWRPHILSNKEAKDIIDWIWDKMIEINVTELTFHLIKITEDNTPRN